ncbi:uncharacterized protein [Nothobranchius furzeri]|uniref:uncharacterized protein n=1 Tax=Nothobranchius furzeri TaxID=105023 RepID=UPI003904A80F
MWDTSSQFTAQTSAWRGSSSASGSGFLSKIRARKNDPGPRRWHSMYNLAPKTSTRWSSSSGSEFRVSGGESSFYPTEAERWLQDTHDRLESQLDWLRTRDMNLSYNTTMANMFDTKQKVKNEFYGKATYLGLYVCHPLTT